jgi:hypothetical protein
MELFSAPMRRQGWRSRQVSRGRFAVTKPPSVPTRLWMAAPPQGRTWGLVKCLDHVIVIAMDAPLRLSASTLRDLKPMVSPCPKSASLLAW